MNIGKPVRVYEVKPVAVPTGPVPVEPKPEPVPAGR